MMFQCTECMKVHKTFARAANCHYGIGGVAEVKPGSVLEAVCSKCGETFNPADEEDTEHIETRDGSPCGGEGSIVGTWSK